MKIIQCSGIIGWDVTPQGIRDALRDANGEDVTLEVSSPGGYIAPGLEIFNLIRNYAGKTTAKLTGYAMSMASYIPLACDRVVAEDNAVYMIHNARGGSWGDHNDILGYGAYLKGLSGVIAKQYVKRTGKTMDEIVELMDKETFFFGDEMVEHGFVDEIIETEKDKDNDTALATARAAFDDAFARMSVEHAQARDDMQRAAALLNDVVQPPAAAGPIPKEVQQMSLNKLLADNPAAKAEHDALVTAARAEGEKAGTAAMAATIEKVAPFLGSNSYPPIVGTTALNVLKGTENMGTLTAAVAAVDAVREDAAAGETAGQQHQQIDPGAVISEEAGLEAAIAAYKGGI
jgi:ATP-dependent protease ClpP protease subunit